MSKRAKIKWPEWVPILPSGTYRMFDLHDVFTQDEAWHVALGALLRTDGVDGQPNGRKAEAWNAAMRRLGYTVIVECDKWDHEA